MTSPFKSLEEVQAMTPDQREQYRLDLVQHGMRGVMTPEQMPKARRLAGWILVFALLAFIALALMGCSTVKQEIVPTASVAGFSGNVQNDGLLGVAYNSQGEAAGFRVDPHWRDRYNALVAVWGINFKPKLTTDAGLKRARPCWIIDAEHYAKFLDMVRWENMGKETPGVLKRIGAAVGVP